MTDDELAARAVNSMCPFCHVALVVLDKPMRFKPMSPRGERRTETFTRQCPICKVLIP